MVNMTGSQYNNIVQWTLANFADCLEDSFQAARAIFTNMGLAFPHGNSREIALTLMSENYMGWSACTCAQAQELANLGIAAVGVDTDHAVVILPDDEAGNHIAPSALAPASLFARKTADISPAERLPMQFYVYYNYSGTTGGSTTNPPLPPDYSLPKIRSNQIIGQSDKISYPSEEDRDGDDVFADTAFIRQVCGKTEASEGYTISNSGCAICSLAMFILHKGGLDNSPRNVYYAVKEAAIKSTDNTAQFFRATFTANVGGKSIKVNQLATDLLRENHDFTIVRNHLLNNKFIMLCLKTGPRTQDMHFVLADEITNELWKEDWDRIRVVDPASPAQRKYLRQAIERKMNPASPAHVLTARLVY